MSPKGEAWSLILVVNRKQNDYKLPGNILHSVTVANPVEADEKIERWGYRKTEDWQEIRGRFLVNLELKDRRDENVESEVHPF